MFTLALSAHMREGKAGTRFVQASRAKNRGIRGGWARKEARQGVSRINSTCQLVEVLSEVERVVERPQCG